MVLDYRSALWAVTKQSEAAKAYFIGHDPDREQGAAPHYGQAGRRNLGPDGDIR